MSKLDELIQELCPDGVQYVQLNEVTRYAKRRIDASEVNEENYVGVENLLQNKQGKTDASAVPLTGSVIAFDEGDVLVGNIRPYLRKVWLADCNGGTNGDVLTIQIINREQITPQFLYYVLSSEQFFAYDTQNSKGAKMPRGDKEAVMKYKIPVPPLEVQREIVRILDNFTETTQKLEEQLRAELTARQKQYEYYRDKLLTFGVHGGATSDVFWRTLAEIADIGTGSSNTAEALDEGLYPFYVRSQEPLRKNEYEFDETAIITAGDGVGVGKVYHFVEGKYALHQRAYRIHINTPDVLPKYYFHYMKSAFLPYIQKTMYHGSVASIRRPMLNNFPVPVPTLDVQERLVHVLDNFDAICSDLNIGLPAEIEARQKQYEFYRDKLLTFAATGDIIAQLSSAQLERSTLIKLCQYVFGTISIRLSDVAVMKRGTYVTQKDTRPGNIPVILGGQEPAYYCDSSNHEGKAIVISRSGAYAGFVSYWDEPIFVTDGFIIEAKDENDIRYIYHCLKNIQTELHGMKRGSGVPHVRGDAIMDIKIPVPCYEKQVDLAATLDRFDALCNDLSSGLPAEIEARQKQYEYYRDKLLTFKEKVV